MKDLIINNTNIKIQESFLEDLSNKAISICPLLKKFPIFMVSHCDTIHAKDVKLNKNDVFICYMNKESEDASSTYAEIIVNEGLCGTLKLTEQEMLAAIAHEIGHIIFNFGDGKESLLTQEEFCCDNCACQMGFAEPLFSLLRKLMDSNLYSEDMIKEMKSRLANINLIWLI